MTKSTDPKTDTAVDVNPDTAPADELPGDALPDLSLMLDGGTPDDGTRDASKDAGPGPMAADTNLSADDRLGRLEDRLTYLEGVLLTGSVHEHHHVRLDASGYSGAE